MMEEDRGTESWRKTKASPREAPDVMKLKFTLLTRQNKRCQDLCDKLQLFWGQQCIQRSQVGLNPHL